MARKDQHSDGENIKPIRLVIVNQFFHPDQTALSQIVTDLVEGLSERNYCIDIVTSRHTQIDTVENPRSFNSNVTVRNVGGTRFGKSTTIGRLLDYVSFYFFAAIEVFRIKSIAIIMTTTAPPMIGLIGVLVKRIRRCKFVYNIQDLYPHTAVALGVLKNKIVIKVFEIILFKILRSADHVIAIGEEMERHIVSMINDGNTSIIHNWADGRKIYPVPVEINPFISSNGFQDKFIVMYSGNFGLGHHFTTFLEAAEKLKNILNIVFVFIGDGKQKPYIARVIKERRLTNVVIRNYEPLSSLHLSLSSAHIGLISLAKGLDGYIVPSKVYSLMAAGQSIIFSGDVHSEVANIIAAAHCGFRVSHTDSDELVRIIYEQYNDRTLNDMLKKNARKYFEQHYGRETALEKYDSTFRKILMDDTVTSYA